MNLAASSPRGFLRAFRLIAFVIALVVAAFAADEPRQRFDLPAGDAAATLRRFAEISGREILYAADAVRGVTTAAVHGEFSPGEALQRMLAGTEIYAIADAAIAVRRRSPASVVRTPVPEVQQPVSEPTSAMKPRTLFSTLGAWLGFALVQATAADGTSLPTATIRGRVFSPESGRYLGNARVVVTPGNRESLSDAFGAFTVTSVPVGAVKVTASYTGYPVATKSVVVAAGDSTEVNFSLGAKEGAADELVTLSAFNVAASRQMDAAVVSLNEQRVAQNIKTVVSADSFGDISDGNVGEFVKFIPGITLGFTGGQASSISIGGLPPASTPIMIDGNRIASAAGETRAIQLDQISLNNMARVEVERTPNADSPADAIGGSVNLVAKSAFERRKASYTVKAYTQFRDRAFTESTYRMKPSFELGAIIPVSSRFGFAINGTSSLTDSAQYISNQAWVPTTLAASATLPATTFAQPYLARYQFGDAPKTVTRQSLGFSADYRLSDRDVLSAGLQYGYFFENLDGVPRDQVIIAANRVTAFGPSFTQGAEGAGTLQLSYSTRAIQGTTAMPSARWRHTGPVWKMEANAAFSRSSYHDRSRSKGFFGPLSAFVRNVTVRFDDPSYLRPGKFTITDARGAVVDPADIANYRLESGGSNEVDRVDIVRSLGVYAQRDLELRVPVRVKAGVDFRSQNREIRTPTTAFTFVGADGIVGTADDSVAPWIDRSYLDRSEPWGLPRRAGFSSREIFKTFLQRPEYFRTTETDLVNAYRSEVTNSKNLSESILAPYARFDLRHLLDNRLKVTAGVRWERTENSGVGPLINPGLIYQRDASGNIVRNAAGAPVAIAPLATLAGTRLAYVERGAKSDREYGQFFPSANATYQATSNLIARLAFSRSISRPDFNTILPSISIPDPTLTTARTITLSNPTLKPWLANSYSASLEYYFGEHAAGLLSARAYRRDISDFWGAITQPVSDELLATYGLDPNVYGAAQGFLASTRRNVGSARISGLEFDYRQSLTFLPTWGKGLAVFGNITMQHMQGATTADFTNFVQKTINYGLSYTHARFTGRVSANERGQERRALFSGAGAEPGTYSYLAPWRKVDVAFEYQVTRAITLYASVRNIFNTPEDQLRYGPNTPGYARLQIRTDYRPFCGFGLKGAF